MSFRSFEIIVFFLQFKQYIAKLELTLNKINYHALFNLLQKWKTSLNNCEIVGSILLDPSKAYA